MTGLGAWSTGGRRPGTALGRTALSLLLAACLLISDAGALVFGPLTVHSHLGQPLRATLTVAPERGETLDPSCFSLTKAPFPDVSSYPAGIALALEGADGGYRLRFSSLGPIREPYVTLVLRAACGQAKQIQRLTALVDPQPAIREAGVSRETGGGYPAIEWPVRKGETLQGIAGGLYPRWPDMQRAIMRAMRAANPDLEEWPADLPLQEGAVIRLPDLRTVTVPARRPVVGGEGRSGGVRPQGEQARSDAAQDQEVAGQGLRLRLSTGPLDLSRVGGLSEAQRRELNEKRKILEGGEAGRDVLALQSRVRDLEDQLQQLRSSLSRSAEVRAGGRTRPSARDAGSVTRGQPASPGGPRLTFQVAAATGAVAAAILALFLLVRRRRSGTEVPAVVAPAAPGPPAMSPPAAPPPASLPPPSTETAAAARGFSSTPGTAMVRRARETVVTQGETVLAEADLYLAYGWTQRAMDTLLAHLEEDVEEPRLWVKLFEIYRAQGMKQEFQHLALRCRAGLGDADLWSQVCELGRGLDPENELYASPLEERGSGG